jgi:Mn2+/Fe2+ NRAMP family transporter
VEVLTRTVVGVIMVCFGLDALLSQPNAVLLAGGMWPNIRGETLYTAMALVGANVMPRRFYLYSPLAKVLSWDDGLHMEFSHESKADIASPLKFEHCAFSPHITEVLAFGLWFFY